MPDGYITKYCGDCGKSPPEARFAAGSPSRCTRCTDAKRVRQAQSRFVHRTLFRDDAPPETPEPAAPDPDRNEPHLAWIRSRGCAISDHGCSGVMHAHHVRTAATAGTGMKPPDSATVCLCATHHADGHQRGWDTFQAEHGINLAALASRLAAESPFIKHTTKE